MNTLADRIAIATPEGVTLELTLAGIGSRLVATVIDGLLQGLFIFVMVLFAVVATVGDESFMLLLALIIIASLAAVVGYPILMEGLNKGQTVGKMAAKIRVLSADGRPASFLQITLRNLFRIIDLLPGAYLVAVISILSTQKLQRVGDLVGGTIVVQAPKPRGELAVLPATAAPGRGWDVSQVTAADLAAIRTFIDRAPELDLGVRAGAADKLARAVLPRVVTHEKAPTAEAFLRQVLAEKKSRQ